MIQVMKSKIHRARVTEANLNYIGSITIDEELMRKSNLIEGEKVQVVNINNGERLETYVIKGKRHSGIICLNGAAARKVAVDDQVIIIGYALMDFEEAKKFKPSIVFPEDKQKDYNSDELRHLAANYAITCMNGYDGSFEKWMEGLDPKWRKIANRKK